MHILVVYNPVSGLRKLRDTRCVIQKYLKKHKVDFTWFETIPASVQPFSLVDFKKIDRIIASGGDGTIRQIADFLIGNKLKIPLGIIAQGSADILAFSLGIPIFPIERALDFALTQKPQPLDVIAINKKHYALIAVGQGYDAHFMQHAHRRLKRVFGIFAYLIAFFKTFFWYRHNNYKLVIDGIKYYAVGKSVLVFNIFSLVGLPLDKSISPRDGRLNIIILNPYSLVDVLRIVMLSLLHYPLTRIPRIQVFSGRKISISSKRQKYIHLDGEVIRGRNVQLEVMPRALEVIYTKAFSD